MYYTVWRVPICYLVKRFFQSYRYLYAGPNNENPTELVGFGFLFLLRIIVFTVQWNAHYLRNLLIRVYYEIIGNLFCLV